MNVTTIPTTTSHGMRRLVLGSVSTKILHSGHTPVLVVPAARDNRVAPKTESQ